MSRRPLAASRQNRRSKIQGAEPSTPSMRTRTRTELPRPPLVAPAPSRAPIPQHPSKSSMQCGRPGCSFRTLETSGLQTASVFLPVRLFDRPRRPLGRPHGALRRPRVYGSGATFFQFKIGMRARAPPGLRLSSCGGQDDLAGSKSPKTVNTRLESAPRLCLLGRFETFCWSCPTRIAGGDGTLAARIDSEPDSRSSSSSLGLIAPW
jgi:hypothetical protein